MQTNRVVWSEGLLLRPQHFQQQDRFIEHQFEKRFLLQNQHQWGFIKLEIDQSLLMKSQVVLQLAQGVLPDGTPFLIPGDDGDSLILEVPPNITDTTVFLCLPNRRQVGSDFVDPNDADSVARFLRASVDAIDTHCTQHTSVQIEIAKPNYYLALGPSRQNDSVSIPVAHIIEAREDGQIILDAQFIAPSLSIRASVLLQDSIKEISGLLSQRRKKLIDRIGGVDEYGIAGLSELLLLQLVNRYESVLNHYGRDLNQHPEALYVLLLQLAGELYTFTSTERSYVDAPSYYHQTPARTFLPLMNDLRAAFNYVFDEPAIRLALEAYKYGIQVAQLSGKNVSQYSRFILAVKADLPLEEVRMLFPTHAKVGPLEKIKDLVNLQLPGIKLTSLPVAPRQIPYHSSFVYFELDVHSELWSSLKQSSGIAIHVGGNFPGLQSEFWAIKG